jgi:hypothetical protein
MASDAPHAVSDTITEVLAPSSLESMTRGEIDIQIVTAKRYPRSLVTFKARALEMATLDQETAESCIYALPRDGKTIEGPSARLAEILASAYGHMRVEGKPIDDDGKFITARGTAWDIQNNVLIAFETKRRITGKAGKRFSDDMIGVTANAATSIAIRNAVLKVVPKAYWGPIYEACRKAAVGDASTLANRRATMLTYFLKLGASNEKVFALLEVAGVEDITLDHLATLKGLATAIKEGETTVDEAFTVGEPAAPPQVQRLSSVAKPVAVRPADPVKPPKTITITGLVHELEQTNDGHYALTLKSGERIIVERDADAGELLKFGGTDHQLRLSCLPGDDDRIYLQSFAIAD